MRLAVCGLSRIVQVYFIFMDESGYTYDWQTGVTDQPYYVASAVCIPADEVPQMYHFLRGQVDQLGLSGQSNPLGLGFEIKARDIARGGGWWGHHNEERNEVRDLFLTSPHRANGDAFVAIIDKKAHLAKYSSPADPYFLAMTFLLERVEMLLAQASDYGYCVYDHNKRLEDQIQEHAAGLIREGSHLMYVSSFLDCLVVDRFKLVHLLECSLGSSKNSVGLQIADYFATMTYHYYCDGKPEECGWWETLTGSLHTKDGKLEGIGLKEFP